MDTAKGEDGSAEQAASLFGAPTMESNSGHNGHKWKSSHKCKVITAVRNIPRHTLLEHIMDCIFTPQVRYSRDL